MSKTVKIFTLKNCPYCSELKKKLKSEEISYEEYDADVYEDAFYKLAEKADSESVPMIVVNKHLLVPEVSFKTIDRAIELIKEKLPQNEED